MNLFILNSLIQKKNEVLPLFETKMNDTFDTDIRQKIYETFEFHEEPFQSAHWLAMEKKLNEQDKRRRKMLYYKIISAAAILLLFINIPFFIQKTENSYSKIFSFQEKNYSETKIQNHNNDSIYFQHNSRTTNYLVQENENIAPEIEKNEKQELLVEIGDTMFSEKNSQSTNYIVAENVTIQSEIENIENQTNSYNENEIQNVNTMAFCILKTKTILVSPTYYSVPVYSLIEIPKYYFANIAENTNQNNEERFVNFNVNVGPQSSFSNEGISEKINLRSGLFSDFRLSKKIRLTTGFQIAQSQITNNSTGNRVMEQITSDYVGLNSVTSNNTSITLNYLDIPLNIKYNVFSNNHSQYYVMTGFSSLMFFQQNYKSEVTYTENIYDNGVLQTTENNLTANTEINSYKPEIAKLINLSFGAEYPLKYGKLIIEPYLKLPIGNVLENEIFLGCGGVSFQYSFGKN